MSRLLILGGSIVLLTAAACRISTGNDCPPDTLDCGQPPIRVYVLTVHVTSESGTSVSGASVRVETPTGVGSGVFRTETTGSTGDAVFDFSYQGNVVRPPQPINVLVTPPPGSSLSTSAVADTVVVTTTETYRVLPIVLYPLATYRRP
jgi:hypothetical protein